MGQVLLEFGQRPRKRRLEELPPFLVGYRIPRRVIRREFRAEVNLLQLPSCEKLMIVS